MMTRQRLLLCLITILFLLGATACARSSSNQAAAPISPADAVEASLNEEESMEAMEPPPEPIAQAGEDPAGEPLPQVAPDAPLSRLIIKRGDMAITVPDTNQAVSQVTGLATSEGGYVISQQVWQQDGFRFASVEFAVPVEAFERTLEILRDFGEVTSETATGEDVTEEFVDLESRLGNLRATQDRLRELLAQAENVEEALAVSRELANIEEELEVVQGRMQYLSERAAFSTIVLTLSPIIPTATPTSFPTPQPTRTPTPWQPGETAQEAVDTLSQTTRTVTNGVIYIAIVCGPWLLLLAIVVIPIFYLIRWWRSRPVKTRRERVARTAAAPHEVEQSSRIDDQLNEEVD